jgi:hypothetical protein
MGDSLHTIAYVSRSRLQGDLEAQLQELAERASRRNAADGLTGALMCSPHYFAQVIEGPLSVLEETFERIQQDRRHQDVAVLFSSPISTRSFPAWGMACAGGSRDDGGIEDALDTMRREILGGNADEAGHRAMDMLVHLLRERELS